MKIFELRWNPLGEKEWVAANTNIEALKIYLLMTATDIIVLDDEDEIVEVPEEKWSEMFVINTDYDRNDPDDWIEKTFAEWMKENKTPGIIAGTVYE